MKKSYLRYIIKEQIRSMLSEADNLATATEEDPYHSNLVGGDTGTNLPMRKIFKMLKDANFNPKITKGNKITGISDIEIGVGDDDFSAGMLTITKNGQTFGDELWGKDIKSEKEIFPLIDEYYKDQIEAEKARVDRGYYQR
jgi:hypothetical protein